MSLDTDLEYGLQHVAHVVGFWPAGDHLELARHVFEALTGDSSACLTPVLDREILGAVLPGMARAARRAHGSVWPGNRGLAMCLTHDVDGVSHRDNTRKAARRLSRLFAAEGPLGLKMMKLAGSIGRLCMEPFGADDLACFEQWVDLEASLGFSSTWYFLPEHIHPVHACDADYAYRDNVTFRRTNLSVAAFMRELDGAGHEIGLHGSYFSGRMPGMLLDQKRQVEAVISKPVRSIRQHYLQFDRELTPRLQTAANLVCDSSVGLHTQMGFPSGTAFPYWCWDFASARASTILQLELNIMDGPLFSYAGRNANRALGHAVAILDAAEAVGGCVTVNWHPNNMHVPGYREVYRDLLQEAHHRGAWARSAGELCDWWSARNTGLSKGVSCA